MTDYITVADAIATELKLLNRNSNVGRKMTSHLEQHATQTVFPVCPTPFVRLHIQYKHAITTSLHFIHDSCAPKAC